VFPGSLLFGLIPGAWNANVTALVTEPVPNIIWLDMMYQVSGQQIFTTIGIIVSVLLIAVATAKFATFYLNAGRFLLEIPQVVFSLCICAGIFSLLRAIVGQDGVWVWFNGEIPQFFMYWQFAFATTASIVFGFYLREVATLTNKPQNAVLKLMFWPAVVVVSFLWVVTIIVSFVSVQEPASADTNGQIAPLSLSAFVVSFFLMIVVVCWGSFSLLFAMNSASAGAKTNLFRIILLSLMQIVILVPTGLCYVITYTYPETTVALYMNEVQLIWLDAGLGVFGPVATCLVIVLNFRVSVQKEIELSKSNTTSSTSSSGRSSSSSSSSADPVIEL